MIGLGLLKTELSFFVHGYCGVSISSIFMNYRENYIIYMLGATMKKGLIFIIASSLVVIIGGIKNGWNS